MEHAKHIGRVGAVAVALGVGMAVATTPGVAWATPDADNATNDQADTPDALSPATDIEATNTVSTRPSSTVSGVGLREGTADSAKVPGNYAGVVGESNMSTLLAIVPRVFAGLPLICEQSPGDRTA